jgi:DNA-binding transcriptional LysR family regulator
MFFDGAIVQDNDPMSRDLDPVLLRAFAAVARLGSVTAAAQHLHLTQGTVSQQLARLEDVLGQRLLDRDHRGARLTPFGTRALQQAERLLAAQAEAWRALRSTAASPVRLGLPPDLIRRWMPAILEAFEAACPGVDVQLRSGTSPSLAQAMAAGELDLAVVESVAPAGGEWLTDDALVWVGAAQGRAHAQRPLPVSLIAPDCAFRPSVERALQAAGIGARFVFEAGDIEATTTLVRADRAVTTWLEGTLPAGLVQLDDGVLPALPRLGIHLHGGARQDPPAEALAQVLRELLGHDGRGHAGGLAAEPCAGQAAQEAGTPRQHEESSNG